MTVIKERGKEGGGKREKHHKGEIKGICFRYYMNHGSGGGALAYRQGVGLLLCAFPIAGISKHSGCFRRSCSTKAASRIKLHSGFQTQN